MRKDIDYTLRANVIDLIRGGVGYPYLARGTVLELNWDEEYEAVEPVLWTKPLARCLLPEEWTALKSAIDKWYECHDAQAMAEETIALTDELLEEIRARRARRTAGEIMPDAAPQRTRGFVYILSAGKYHKIGMTFDLGHRIGQIQPRLPFPSSLFHYIETDTPGQLEAELHSRFAAQRANGEWFTLTEEDLSWLKTL